MDHTFHSDTLHEVLSRLETDQEQGLSLQEGEKRLAEHGENRLEEAKQAGMLRRVLGQLKDPMILVLLAAAALSFFAGGGQDWLDAAIILVIVAVNACISISQEDNAEKALEALRKALNETAAAHGAVLPLALPGDPPDREPLKLTLDAAALGCSGQALAEVLRQHGIECEYADPRYLVLMFTPENPPQDYDRLREAITACCTARPLGSAPAEEDTAGNFAVLARELAENGPRCTIREAILAPQEVVPAEEALGRVCAMPTVSCPPAIPVAVSGEEITPAAIALMQRYGIEELSLLR